MVHPGNSSTISGVPRTEAESGVAFLTPNFSLAEMCANPMREFDNTPPSEVLGTLRATARRMEQVRAMLDAPVIVWSAYRCRALNRALGGSRTSAHLSGYGVDFICPRAGSPIDVIRRLANRPHLLQFDQLIEEGAWVHISFDPRMRGQVLTRRDGGGYGLGLPAAQSKAGAADPLGIPGRNS